MKLTCLHSPAVGKIGGPGHTGISSSAVCPKFVYLLPQCERIPKLRWFIYFDADGVPGVRDEFFLVRWGGLLHPGPPEYLLLLHSWDRGGQSQRLQVWAYILGSVKRTLLSWTTWKFAAPPFQRQERTKTAHSGMSSSWESAAPPFPRQGRTKPAPSGMSS